MSKAQKAQAEYMAKVAAAEKFATDNEANWGSTAQDEFKKLMDGVDSAKAQAEAMVTLEKAQADAQVVDDVDIGHLDTQPKDDSEQKAQDEYLDAFNTFIANSRNASFNPSDILQTKPNSDGGYLLPETWDKRIIELLRKENKIRSLATVSSSSTTVNITIQTGQINVDWILENGAFPKSNETFDTAQMKAYKYGGIVLASDEIIRDSFTNIRSRITNGFAHAFAPKEQLAFISGDGDNKPTGFLDAIPDDMIMDTAESAKIGLDDIIDLPMQVADQILLGGSYFMSRTTATMIRKLADSTGQKLWQPSNIAGQPSMINGYPVVIVDGLPEPTADNVAVFFGDLKGYLIKDRERGSLQVLNELYAANGQIGFKMHRSVDGKLIDKQRLAGLRITA
jgi:HK97 family phage major capsid protein